MKVKHYLTDFVNIWGIIRWTRHGGLCCNLKKRKLVLQVQR